MKHFFAALLRGVNYCARAAKPDQVNESAILTASHHPVPEHYPAAGCNRHVSGLAAFGLLLAAPLASVAATEGVVPVAADTLAIHDSNGVEYRQVEPLLGATAGTLSAGQASAVQNAPAIGERRVAAILVNFSDNPREPGSRNEAQAVFDGPINDYYLEASYGQMHLITDVYGWWTLPMSSERCSDTGSGLVSTEILQEAALRGVDLSGYNHLVYIFDITYGLACPGAVGTVTGAGGQGKVWRAWVGATETAEVAFDGIKGIEGTIHELGHNLGLWHANRWDCGADIVGTECAKINYGDIYDAMGSGSTNPQFNAFHKERLGWILPGEASANRLEVVDQSNIYAISAYGEPGGTKALKIRRGPGVDGGTDYFYLEYRQPIGWDAGLLAPAYQGVLLRLGNDVEADSSRLLDMTPEEPWHHALLPGTVFRDPLSQVEFEVLEVTPQQALVSVFIGADTTPPQLQLVFPLDGDVLVKGTTVTLTATASDDSALGAVAFYVDGAYECRATRSAQSDEYSCGFPVPKGKSRSLDIEARAVDAAGNEARKSVTVSSGSSDDTSGGSGSGKPRGKKK